ncbi:hypothetical protein ASA1KI_11150 [Opitutales bacterium ASA1]|uniref:hypothetical protein n=1 Tax=Congregicoccus parvus TaxID=3081749 RepID=UPI002B31F2CB|nr:hypothetical protein ASA1KI_11150 [Opitutales bacterium ASA1]
MNTLSFFSRLLVVVSLGFLASSAPACAQYEEEEADYGEFFERVPVPEGISKEELRDMVAVVLATRGWTIQQKTDRRVVGYLKHRGNEATATMLFTGDTVDIYCEGWAINKSGQRTKPEQPRGWLGNLRKDLTRRFSTFVATH